MIRRSAAADDDPRASLASRASNDVTAPSLTASAPTIMSATPAEPPSPALQRALEKMREVYTKKLEETREHIRRLQALEHELQSSLGYLDTCEEVCDPARVVQACDCCDLHGCEDHVPELVAGFRAQ